MGKTRSKNPSIDSGDLRQLGAQINRRHYEALEQCAKSEQRTKKVIIERALELYFQQAGIWPAGKQ